MLTKGEWRSPLKNDTIVKTIDYKLWEVIMELEIVAAFTKRKKVIGKDNKLIWHFPEDLARFKNLTTGCFCITGRKTFESLPPLPDRTLIVLTSQRFENKEHVFFVNSLQQALSLCREQKQEKVFCIGGAEIYKLCLPITSKLHITEILTEYNGDTFFPPFSKKDFSLEKENKSGSLIFKTYKRRK